MFDLFEGVFDWNDVNSFDDMPDPPLNSARKLQPQFI
jgi:hypothetical protein